MKENWALIYRELENSPSVVEHLGHSATTPKIFRASQFNIVKEQDHILIFETSEGMITEATPDIREVAFHITILSKISDVDVEEIGEKLISELDGRKITDENLNTFDRIYWDNYKSTVAWDEDDKCWFQDLRFRLIVSKKGG